MGHDHASAHRLCLMSIVYASTMKSGLYVSPTFKDYEGRKTAPEPWVAVVVSIPS